MRGGATIYVAGTMTNWNTGAKAMSGSGTVSVEFQLTGGTYEYRIVDDQQKDGTKPNNWHWVKTSPSSSSGVTSISNFTSVSSNNVSFTLASSASKYTVVIYYNTSTYTTYVKATLPATTYTISYDANGGTGAPADQTKIEGKDLTLSSTVPTRTGYIFTGWNTAANGSGTEYASGDSYTANAAATLYAQWCAPSTTLSTANYDAVNNEIDLSGSIVTCGKELFYGFLWKNKEDANWNTANAISGTGGNNNKTKENKEFAHSWNGFTPGTTYEFTAYALDATTNPYTWYYSTNENDVIEVSTCTSIPDNAYAIAGNNEWTGNANPVTINYDANTYGTPTILYDGEAQIPTDVGTYAITINVPAHNGYCASTISLGDYEITCIDVEKPDVTASATICEGQVTLSDYNGNNTNTVKWYSNSACTAEVTQPVTPTDGTKYYAKAYHEASGCYSSQYSTLTFKVNPLPTISIGDNTTAVKFEDVKLTATGNNIADVTWIADKGTIIEDAIDPKKAVLTYDQADAVTVTATATSAAGCTSVAATKTVTFGEEKCSTGKTKIRFRKTYNNNEYWGFNTGSVYLYSWDSKTDAKYTGSYPGTLLSKTETIDGITYYVHEFTNAQSTENLTILFRAQYDYGGTLGKTYDIPLSTPGATYQIELKNGDKKKETDDKDSDNSNSIDYFEVNSTPSGGGIIITAPAVKTVSVTSDEDGNVTMVGQVVKTGCDTQAILGLQYKKQNPDGTTYEANYTTYPNPGTKEAISAGKTFTVTTKLEDGTYLVRARIDNSHATNGYGEDIKVVVNTTKTPISNVTLNYCDKNGGNVGVDPNPMCKGAIAYVKLSYVGSKYSDIKWLVEGVETNLVTDEGDGVWSYEIQGDGSLSVELKNDANTDPAWPYSNKLPFSIIPEPTAPYISIDPASGVICQGSSATIKVENPSKACSYKLVEEGSKAGFTPYESGDLKYTVQNVGKYYVVAQHNACSNEYTSNQVAINQIISTNANISIDPAKAETTPWEPVTITVRPDAGYIYELSYTDGNLAAVDGVRIKQNGDSYTYYIPRPDSWGTGDATSARETVNYGIEAQLKVDGEESTCKLKAATAIIQLKDEDNENCPK